MTGGHSLILAGPAAETTRLLTFWVLAIASVLSALGMVLARRAVHCALLLAVVMLSLAVFYAMEGAPFLAFVQVIVYTGAVLMLFLFVLMIVGITAADSIIETIRGQRLWAILGGLAMLVLLVLVIGHAVIIGPAGKASAQFGNANVTALAHLIFTRYVFPFEITSALLITAAVGAMVLAHRERLRPKPTQREMAAARIAGSHPTPLPGPGTYAQHNAVDMPALLPDGSQSELSVSPVLTGGRAASVSTGRPPALGGTQAEGSELPAGPGPQAGEQ
ncbi:MAG TPA: NADH-quinone oxidoreductase subunit J [Streptosporangiaceae bacterium]